jgi:hypothetical protein
MEEYAMPTRYPFRTGDFQRGAVEVGGDVFFASSVHTQAANSPGLGGTPEAPYSTLTYAMTQAAANHGDVIYLMPGYTQTLSGLSDVVLDKHGVTIQGLGNGLNRPTFTLDTATTTRIRVSGNNVTVRNCIFTANFADIVTCFLLGGAKDFRVEDCLFKATAANMNFLHLMDTGTTDNADDGFTFVNNKWIEPDAATLAFMLLDNAIDRMVIDGNTMITGHATVDVAALITGATGKNMTGVSIANNRVYITGNTGSVAGLFITTDGTAGTGFINDNKLYTLDATTELFITATHHFGLFNNLVTGVWNAQGRLVPGADS